MMGTVFQEKPIYMAYLFAKNQTQTFALLSEKCCYQKTTGRIVQMCIDDWDFDKERYIYIQLAHKIESAIFSKEFNAGDAIPSIRKMAEILQVNPSTVMQAYKIVSNDGFIIASRNGCYTINTNEEYIAQKREDAVKKLCCLYLLNINILF